VDHKRSGKSHTKEFRAYGRINSANSPASGAGNASEHRLTSQVKRVREIMCM
jgi:hypothetical protein